MTPAAVGPRHREQARDIHRAGGLAEDGDVAGVAAEGRNLVPDPLEGRHLVQHRLIAGGVEPAPGLPGPEEPEGPQAIVDGDDHPVTAPHEVGGIVRPLRSRADDPGAPVNPHHDRPPGAIAGRGSPHVEREAILALLVDQNAEDRGQAPGASGAPNRLSPTGGFANGIPRNTRTPPSTVPRTRPRRVSMTGPCVSDLIASRTPAMGCGTLG